MVRPPAKSKGPKVTRLPLSKFSHTTTTIDHSGPLSWTHVNDAQQLTCVLEQSSTCPSTIPRLLMRVSQNNMILEQLDLSHFIQRSAAQSHSAQGASQAKPPFAVVVKSPCLAVKYPQTATHIRRFQIKFSRNTDYFTALAFLSEYNCPFTEGSTAITAQPLRRLPTSSSLASFQAPTITSKAASTTAPSEDGAAVTLLPMSGYMPCGIPTPHPPSSTTSTVYNLASHNVPPQNTDQYQNTSSGQTNLQLTITGSDVRAPQKVNTRTSTAPAYHGNQLDEMLPPKRALPFLKPAQKAPLRERSNVSDISQYAQSEGQLNGSSRNTQLLPFTKNQTLLRYDSELVDSQSYSPAPTQPYPDPPPSSQREVPHLSEHSLPETAEQPHGVYEAQMNISTDRPRENEKTLEATHTAQSKGIQPAAISAEQLSTYLSTPTPERIELLENWMCELIEDDKFMELCQDVEATWKRFAFGARE
ncbi:hypothetical protein N7478_003110 [Penicillium angulare]|uniref:uncharacterized protein n=1 Tax=Penicillium angulare TaxID=116970 RepID=UPI0025404884|nr:uncharacterized protein N7478_003110 [Penicillium angulare]KAJ5287424.1 hypothetical protein N7478_003110 [Penicillium angulare]